MARRLSRRLVANHVASRLAEGDKAVIGELAAYLISTRQTSKADVYIRDIESSLVDLGIAIADTVSAFSLSVEIKKQITELLKDELGAKEVVFRESVDESVLGGVRVETPGHKLDTTVSEQLKKLRTRHKKS